jgi:adenylate kinase
MMLRMIMIGSAGSGKGTYSSRICTKFGVPTISMGQVLRDSRNDPEVGPVIVKCQDDGILVPDKITCSAIKKRIEKPDCENGYILDGYPRSLGQAEAISDIPMDFIINLIVPFEIVIKRLTSRRQCKKCGDIYNVLYLKPKVDGVCDKCGGELFQRDDDQEEAIQKRLDIYVKETRPLIDYYKGKVKIIDIECTDINSPPSVMVEKILNALKKEGVEVPE